MGGAGVDRALGLVATGDGGVVLTGGTTRAPGAGPRRPGPKASSCDSTPRRPAWVHRFGRRRATSSATTCARTATASSSPGTATGRRGATWTRSCCASARTGANAGDPRSATARSTAPSRPSVLDDGSSIVVGYSRARGRANDTPVWTTMLARGSGRRPAGLVAAPGRSGSRVGPLDRPARRRALGHRPGGGRRRREPRLRRPDRRPSPAPSAVTCAMRPLRYSINVTLDGCCDHRVSIADEDFIVTRPRTSPRPMPSSLAG